MKLVQFNGLDVGMDSWTMFQKSRFSRNSTFIPVLHFPRLLESGRLILRRCLRAFSDVSGPAGETEVAKKSSVFSKKRFPFGLRDNKDAKLAAEKMDKAEKKLLFDALRKSMADQYNEHKRLGNAVVHSDDYVALWHIYFWPHLAVGMMHSATFIFAGEHLQGFGAYYGLTVMGAAGLGNVVSNVLMLNFSKQVEGWMAKAGIKRPILSAEQMHNPEVHYLIFVAKLLGMFFGSLIGLFPLMIYEHPVDRRDKMNKHKHATYARSFQEETSFQYAQAEEEQERLQKKKKTNKMKKVVESSPEDLQPRKHQHAAEF